MSKKQFGKLLPELDFYIESGISADEFINQKLRELE